MFGNPPDVAFANDQFTEVFQSGQLDNAELRRLADDPGGVWQPVKLSRRNGRDDAAYAQAVAVADSVLVVFDEADDPLKAQEGNQLRERIAELESLSTTDRLTGAGNRVQLERTVDVEISRARRFGQPTTLILLDIDHFKQVNDRHGHLAGDAVLKESVARMRGRMRDIDSLFRWGGDEFVVLAPSVGYQGGSVLAERLRRTIAEVPFGPVGTLTASLGVTEHIADENAESWFLRTDQALYAAKAAGRNQVHIDRQGSTDIDLGGTATGLLRLVWQDAYECGIPAIDAEHRELFDLGNALIAAAVGPHSKPAVWRPALDAIAAHLAQHFREEEAQLSRIGYARLAEHQRAHAGLMKRADDLRAAVERGGATLGHLVNFLVNDVIVLHLLKVDTEYYPLLRAENDGGAGRAPS